MMIFVETFLKRLHGIPLQTFHRLQQCRRFRNGSFLSSKMFLNENNYALGIMERNGYTSSLIIEKNLPQFTTDEFQKLLDDDCSKKKPREIFEAFALLGDYCSANGLCITNKMFDNFIDHLTDSIHLASDNELESIALSLLKWPKVPSNRSRNFIEVWAALDDACLNRLRANEWTFDKILLFVSHFYKLYTLPFSDFCKKGIEKLAGKVKSLNNGQFVQIMFFIGITRRQVYDMHILEQHLDSHLSEFTLDELAIISMGFSKSKTPLRSLELRGRIIDAVKENLKTVHEVSLAALLKIFCSKRISAFNLLEELQHELPRLSVVCNVRIALLGAATLNMHKECLTKIADFMITRMSETRLKDLERLVFTYKTFNYAPPTKECFFEKIIEELRNPARIPEIEKHGRSFVSCIEYLSIMEKYPLDLIEKALSHEFLRKTYGKHCYFYNRSLLAVHNIAKLYGSEDNINCLTDKEARVLAKKFTDYVPDENYPKQYNVSERMLLDVMKVLRQHRGEGTVVADHIVTHYQHGDAILCNAPDGTPLPVDKFDRKAFGLLRRRPDNNIWIALVIVGQDAIIHGTDTPTGHILAKVRILNLLGFRANLVVQSIYSNLDSDDKKINYLNNVIEQALVK